jgi:hypothetical protein
MKRRRPSLRLGRLVCALALATVLPMLSVSAVALALPIATINSTVTFSGVTHIHTTCARFEHHQTRSIVFQHPAEPLPPKRAIMVRAAGWLLLPGDRTPAGAPAPRRAARTGGMTNASHEADFALPSLRAPPLR